MNKRTCTLASARREHSMGAFSDFCSESTTPIRKHDDTATRNHYALHPDELSIVCFSQNEDESAATNLSERQSGSRKERASPQRAGFRRVLSAPPRRIEKTPRMKTLMSMAPRRWLSIAPRQ